MRLSNQILSNLILPVVVSTAALALPAAADAQDLKHGQDLARRVCATCHAVENNKADSPNPKAPPFRTVANTPGMTETALTAFLTTPHRGMPDLILSGGEIADVSAYILSMKDK